MKKSDLLEIIRTVVREEVNNALPQLLMEVLAEKISNSGEQPKRAPSSAPTFSPAKQSITEQARKPMPSRPPKVYSTNPILNAVLNETQGGVPVEDDNPVASSIDIVQNIPKEVLAENTAVAAVANALTKNYSSILKAADAKAKSSRP